MSEKKEITPRTSNLGRDAQVGRRLGGLKGGKARAEKLSPERRREIALKATKARWSKTSSERS